MINGLTIMEEKEKLVHLINFRATEEMYKDLIKYLEQANKTISTVMRQATWDYLKLQEAIKKNGYGKSEPVKKKKQEVKVDLDQIEANKFCDGNSCELPAYDKIRQKKSC